MSQQDNDELWKAHDRDYGTFAAWWDRTYGYEAHPAMIAQQERRSVVEECAMQTPSPLALPTVIGPPTPAALQLASSNALQKEGVVRMKGALSAPGAAALLADVLERRTAAYAAVDAGGDWRQHFGDVVLKDRRTRCDLLLPLAGARGVQLALRDLLVDTSTRDIGKDRTATTTPLYELLAATIGEDAVLYELSVLISEPGTTRQLAHHDNHQQINGCLPLVTCFVALQDVTPSMGGTIFLLKTHTAAAHAEVDRDALLARSPSVVAHLGAGDASVYDSRIFHLGGANIIDGGSTRAIFYVSFVNPNAESAEIVPGSLRTEIKSKSVTLRELKSALETLSAESVLPFCDIEEKAALVDAYRLRAMEGESAAQLSLGLCYGRGEGSEVDHIQSVRWFRLAAAQGEALAQTNLGHCYSRGHGVEKNEEEAVGWYALAAAQGEADAQYSLGICYHCGLGVQSDTERALGLHMDAAAQGHFGAKGAYDAILRTQRA